ncbi:hypothetical protein [Microvirga arabica]|uniref:hypothetical protein n=1 Tax=Microvirga arabica TaxID=1128671 RepID=UPI00193A26FE|nr:hypothetical protein [Microvirga arabica]MBM1172851.1 hypothetical protein [Microvirga arabica]
MQTTTITIEELADILKNMPDAHLVDGGSFMSTTGYHWSYGFMVIIQTIDEIILVSEVPLPKRRGHGLKPAPHH